MKSKILIILSTLFLIGCGVVQPEEKDAVEEETKPNDEIIIGITDKAMTNPYIFEENTLEFYNSEEFKQSFENFFTINNYIGSSRVTVTSGFDDCTLRNSGNIIAENENGISLINAKLTYPVFEDNLTEKYHFHALVLNVQQKTIYSEPFSRVLGLEKGEQFSISLSREITFASIENDTISKYYKYSAANVSLIGDDFELESYVMHEYDSNHNLIKSNPGVVEDYYNYVADENCNHVIMEKVGYKYEYDFDTSSLVKTPIVLWESFNKDSFNSSSSFFTKQNEKCEKIKIFVNFNSVE